MVSPAFSIGAESASLAFCFQNIPLIVPMKWIVFFPADIDSLVNCCRLAEETSGCRCKNICSPFLFNTIAPTSCGSPTILAKIFPGDRSRPGPFSRVPLIMLCSKDVSRILALNTSERINSRFTVTMVTRSIRSIAKNNRTAIFIAIFALKPRINTINELQ